MRNRFDQQLELLNKQLIYMGELCEEAIGKATTALKEGSMEQAEKVRIADEEIDQAETDIERLCLRLLLQQQPVARDLRQISAALKMITDMERIGDQASDIAEIIITEDKSEAQDIPMIIKMSEAASKMVRDSVNAYVEKDLDLARKVMENDDVVDELFERLERKETPHLRHSDGSHIMLHPAPVHQNSYRTSRSHPVLCCYNDAALLSHPRSSGLRISPDHALEDR